MISGGIIVTSEDSGIFDGVLPGVGSPGYFSVSLPNTYDFSLDLSEFMGREVILCTECAVHGCEFVPEPGSTLAVATGLLGVLVLDRSARISKERRHQDTDGK